MKLFKTSAIATALLIGTISIGTMAMGTASAITLDAPGVTSASVNVSVKNGVATLFGTVDSSFERAKAERHIAKMDGVDKVINLISYN